MRKSLLKIAACLLAGALFQGTATADGPVSARVMSLDGPWLLECDPQNVGREKQWYTAATPEAKPTRVPWIIQEVFPGYHGVAWYWRELTPPANPVGSKYSAEMQMSTSKELTNSHGRLASAG